MCYTIYSKKNNRDLKGVDFMRTMDKETFTKWVVKNFYECTDLMGYNARTIIFQEHFEEFLYTSKTIGHFVITKNNRKLTITNLHSNKHGSSFLKNGDDFDIVTGIGIAWARLKNEEIPVINENIIHISDLKYSDIFKLLGNDIVYCFVATHPTIQDCFIATTISGSLIHLRVHSSTQVVKI